MTRLCLQEETWLYRGVADHPDARAVVLHRHLAELLGCDSGEIAIARDDAGKPGLIRPATELWFNTAGRDGLLVIATSRRGPVGVDVETLAHCHDTLRVAQSLFAPGEASWLERQPEDLRPISFARLWTAKEAVLKAGGIGIGQGVAKPDLGRDLPPGAPPWPAVVAKLDDAPYTVAWYTSTVDEAFVIAARAQAEMGHFRTS